MRIVRKSVNRKKKTNWDGAWFDWETRPSQSVMSILLILFESVLMRTARIYSFAATPAPSVFVALRTLSCVADAVCVV